MVDSVDVDCAMNILGKQAVDIAQKTGTLALRITARLFLTPSECTYQVWKPPEPECIRSP